MTDTTPHPTSERRTRTRMKLLDAGFDVFAENGFNAASLELICERAGLTRGAFYYNFSTKEELFLAVMEREFERSMSSLLSFSAGQLDDTEPSELPQLVLALNSGLLRDQVAWATLTEEFRLHAMRDPSAAAAFTEQFTSIHERLGREFQKAADVRGLSLLAPPETIAAIVTGIFLQAVSEGVLAKQSTEHIQQIAADRMLVTLQGLMPPA